MQTETLAHGTKVLVTQDHKFGADALFLAHFANVRRAESAADFGTGCGIIPLRWHDRGHRGACIAVEISAAAIAQLTAAVQENAIDHITPVCADLRTWKTQQLFDVITCNPPYFTGGILSENSARALARHEKTCTVNDVCTAASPLLKDGGRLCLCQKPERLADVIAAMRQNRIEPKRLQFITVRCEKEPWLFLIEGQKNRASGLHVLPPLVTENSDGTRPSAAVAAIYNL